MEGISTSVCKGVRSYWKRRGYERLNKHCKNHVQADPFESTGSDFGPNCVRGRRRRFFRVKVGPRMRVWRKIVGMPKKWLTRFRDAYVKMMLNLANSGLAISGTATGFGGSLKYGYGYSNYKGQLKEYDERMIIEIYKSLMIAQGQLASAPNKVNPQQCHLRRSPIITISAR